MKNDEKKVLVIEFGIKKIADLKSGLISENFEVLYADNFLDVVDCMNSNKSKVVVISDFRGVDHTSGYIRMFKKTFNELKVFIISNGRCHREDMGKYLKDGAYRIIENMDYMMLRTYIETLCQENQEIKNAGQYKVDPDFVVAYIRNNYSGQVNIVNELSIRLGCCERTINKILKNATGKTIAEWTTEYRLRGAKRLLENPEYTIKSISNELGFRSTQGFIHLFYRNYGVTPTNYRRSKSQLMSIV